MPYKGGAPALNDAIAGHLQTVAVNALEALPHARSGKLRVLAVLSPSRSPIFPDVPTIADQVSRASRPRSGTVSSGRPGCRSRWWRACMPRCEKALTAPEVRERLVGAGGEVLPGPVDRFASLLTSERGRYDKLIREARIQPD